MHRWYVIVDGEDNSTKEAVISEAGFGHALRALPIVEVEGPDNLPIRLAKFKGVKSVLPAMKAGPTIRRIVEGLDIMTFMARLQNAGRLQPEAFGGREQGAELKYPILRTAEDTSWSLDHTNGRDWPAGPAVLPVVNMSFGPRPSNYPYLDNDIVNLATAAASDRMVVVMAAGNCGQLASGETLSAWAEAPWVLSVGATSDEEGTTLADYSSRGTPDNPRSGPDVVAYGTSAFFPNPEGTSFAAPRVTHMIRCIAAAMLQLQRAVEVVKGGTERGVPLVGTGVMDDFGDEMFTEFPKPIIRTPALPILGPVRESIEQCIAIADSASISVDVVVGPSHAETLLIKSARQMPGYGQHEVGAGFVSNELVLGFLASLTGADLVEWYGSGEGDESIVERLAEIRIFDREELEYLPHVAGQTGPSWHYNWRIGRYGRLPVDPEDYQAMSSDEQKYGEVFRWPPADELLRLLK
jgi:hypothetical protein